MRCQVYIPKELEEVLLNDAKKAGVNVSEIIIRILKKNYKTKNSETLDYIALKDIVFKEIEEYIVKVGKNKGRKIIDLDKRELAKLARYSTDEAEKEKAEKIETAKQHKAIDDNVDNTAVTLNDNQSDDSNN